MDERVKVLLKHFIKALSEIYGFDEIQTVRKVARFINTNESVVITKLLYSCIKEGE